MENGIKRNENGTFAEGTAPGPGRPKGESLKEYWRRKFYSMTEEEKEEFSKKVGFETIWRMAEGNPKQDNDITSGGKPIVVLSPEIVEKNNINGIETAI